MQLPAKTLLGEQLEAVLLRLSGTLVASVYQGDNPTAIYNLRMGMVEIGRWHLAGLSEHQIMEERASPSRNSRTSFILYEEMVAALGKLLITDPVTGEKFVPRIGELMSTLEIERDSSINSLRTNIVSKQVNAFVEGDYITCARSGCYAASIFGSHLLYQLGIVGNIRLGWDEAAESAGRAAKMGLLRSPWHSRLVELTLGLVAAADLVAEAKDDNARFQVKVFEGIRALSKGDDVHARTCLSTALAMPNDLPLEYLMAKADLSRGGRTKEQVNRLKLVGLCVSRIIGGANDILFDALVSGTGSFDDPFEIDLSNFIDQAGNEFAPDEQQRERANLVAMETAQHGSSARW